MSKKKRAKRSPSRDRRRRRRSPTVVGRKERKEPKGSVGLVQSMATSQHNRSRQHSRKKKDQSSSRGRSRTPLPTGDTGESDLEFTGARRQEPPEHSRFAGRSSESLDRAKKTRKRPQDKDDEESNARAKRRKLTYRSPPKPPPPPRRNDQRQDQHHQSSKSHGIGDQHGRTRSQGHQDLAERSNWTASSQHPRSRSYDDGAMNMIYMSTSPDSSIVKVAEDVRNVGPILVVVCCSDDVQAEEMYVQLVKNQIGPPTGWKQGQGPRPPPDKLQYRYRCSIINEIIVGGRINLVEDIKLQELKRTPDGAEVNFVSLRVNNNVQGIDRWVLAVFGHQSSQCSRDSWDDLGDAMMLNSVRLMVGDFGGRNVFSGASGLEQLLVAVRRHMQTHVCALELEPDEGHADRAGETSTRAIVVNGPVTSPPAPSKGSNAEMLLANLKGPANDSSSAWMSIKEYWTKQLEQEFRGTQRIFVYLGSWKSSRSPEAIERRRIEAIDRMKRNHQKYKQKCIDSW